MAKMKLNEAKWHQLVTSADTKVKAVSAGKQITLSKNTLSSFKSLFTVQEKAIAAVKEYKTANSAYTEKMQGVAKKIVEDDQKAGQAFAKNSAKVRFD